MVNRYRYKLDIPVSGGTRIDRTLTKWSPWMKFGFTEVVIPILDLEGGYKFILEYETNDTKEILRYEKTFYVFRFIVGYSDEAVPTSVVRRQTNTHAQSGVLVSTPASNAAVSENNLNSDDEIKGKITRKIEVPVLAKLEINPHEIDILKLVSKETLHEPGIATNVNLADLRKNSDAEDISRIDSFGEVFAVIKSSGENEWESGLGNSLFEALIKNDIELIKNSITEGSVRCFREVKGANIFHLLNDLNSDNEVINMLVNAGASLNEIDNNGNSPLHLAILNRQNNYARLLINKGADLNLKNKLGLSPLHIASILDSRVIAGELMIRGADVNIRGNTGYTPLHIAAELNYSGLAGDLIQMGASPRIKTSQGLNSKNIANIQKNRELGRFISGKNNYVTENSVSSSLQIVSYIGTSVLKPKFEFILPYDEALIKKRQSIKIIKMISIPVLVLGSSGFVLLKSRADFYYTSYRKAESIETARHFYDRTLQYDTYSYFAGGLSVLSLYGIVHSMVRKKNIESRMFKVFY